MISAIAWVRRGAAARVPKTEGDLDEEADELVPVEAAASAGTTKKKALASPEGGGGGSKSKRTMDDVEEEEEEEGPRPLASGELMYYGSNKDDPNITLKEDDDLDSEAGDFLIGATDLVLLGARSDEQISNLEAYVYEEPHDNLYPHHDIPLPVYPLCLAWMDFRPQGPRGAHGGANGGGGGGSEGARGNFAAVGTFAPYIEIWDLDIIDALEPYTVLGAEAFAQASEEQFTSQAAEALAASSRQKHGGGRRGEEAGGSGSKKSKKKKKATLGEGAAGGPEGHSDAVMCLSWNTLQPNALASGSADHTVRLWDLEGDCAGSVSALRHHRDKVQALQWNPAESPILLSAGFDRRAIAVDVRAPDTCREWALSADAEKVCWEPSGVAFLAATEDGVVRCFDVRKGGSSPPVWALQAHSSACSGLDFCPGVSGVFATGGQDKYVKLWSLSRSSGGSGGSGGLGTAAPTLIGKRNMQLGGIFDVSFSRDSPALLAAGGAKGKLGIWNTLALEEMQALLPHAEAAIGDDGRVLSGAVAGMSALDVNSSDDEDEEGVEGEEEGGGKKKKKDQKKKKDGASLGMPMAGAAAQNAMKNDGVEEEDEEEEEDEDEEEEDDDDEEEEEAEKVVDEEEESRTTAAVVAAAMAARKKARRGGSKGIKIKRK